MMAGDLTMPPPGEGGDPMKMLWQAMGVTGGAAVWWSTLGVIFQAMILSGILGQTVEYFDYFKKRDNQYLLHGVAVGTVVAIGTVGITCAQTYVLVHQTLLNPPPAIRFLMMGDMVLLLVGALFNVAAGAYYAWRAYKMSGKNKYVVVCFALGLAGQLAASIIAVSNGFTFPLISPETIPQLPAFMSRAIQLFKIWGAITMSVDGALCVFMTVMLVKTKDSIFHREKRLYKKLISFIYETMLPPVVCLIVLQSTSWVEGNPITDFRRIITSILPVLYYHSLIHSLVARKRVRVLLDGNLAKEGFNMLSDGAWSSRGAGVGGGSGKVYASFPKS